MTLPYPPSLNGYYRNVNGRTLISKRGRQYRGAVLGALLVQHPHLTTMEGPLHIDIKLRPRDRRTQDLDNPLKGLFDALEKNGVVLNDSQFRSAHIEFLPPAKPGEVYITIRKKETHT